MQRIRSLLMYCRCKYVDQQTLKLQEAPEAVPTGEMPRHIILTVDRSIVGFAVPGNISTSKTCNRCIDPIARLYVLTGTRVEVIGLYTVFNDAKKQQSVKHAYMRVMGMEDTTNTGVFVAIYLLDLRVIDTYKVVDRP
jgi:DNA replicative helicase MCM subunit Mcm2 (Cdc46/Mcm family)